MQHLSRRLAETLYAISHFRAITLVIVALAMAEFVREAFTIVFLPIYATEHLGLSLTMISVAIAVHYLTDTLFKGPAGHLVDRLGPRWPLLFGFTLTIIALVLMTRPWGAWWLILMNGVYGVATAPNWPSVVTSANRLAGDAKKGSVMGIVFAAWLGGAALGPIIVNFLITKHGRLAMLVMLAALALGTLAVVFFREPPTAVTPTVSRHPEEKLPLLQHLRRIWILIPGMLAQNLALGVLVPVVTLFASRIVHLSHYHYSLILIVGGGLAISALTLTGKVADRIGPRIPLAGGFILLSLTLFGVGHADSFREILPLVIVASLSYAVVLPAWNLLLARNMPQGNEGSFWGIFMAIEGLGLSIGSLFGGRLWDLFGPRAPFELSAAILGLMAVFYLLYPIHNLTLAQATPPPK